MLKLTGSLLIIAVCSMIGVSRSKALKSRTERLRQLSRLMVQTSELIRYKHSTVGEILDELKRDECFRILLSESSPREDKEQGLIKEFLSQLGTTDTEGQLSMIALCRSRCEELISISEKEEAAKCRLYEQLGFMCGAFIAVMLI